MSTTDETYLSCPALDGVIAGEAAIKKAASMDVNEWLEEHCEPLPDQNLRIGKDQVNFAITQGRVDVLKYLRKIHCAWPDGTLNLSITCGQIEVCKWLVKKHVFTYTRRNTKHITIHCIRVCILSKEHLSLAARSGQIAIGKWILNNCYFPSCEIIFDDSLAIKKILGL